MSSDAMAGRTVRSVAEVCEAAGIGEDARKVWTHGMPPQRYVELLVENNEFPDAVRFMAHVLPKREAVWWAWVCARRSAGPDPPPPIHASLSATEKWIAQPNEENRRSAMKAAEEAQFSSAAGCAGLAAFFSGGSLSPPGAQATPPGEFMTAKAVVGAVMMAAVATEPEQAAEKYRGFVTQAVEVAHKTRLWEKTT